MEPCDEHIANYSFAFYLVCPALEFEMFSIFFWKGLLSVKPLFGRDNYTFKKGYLMFPVLDFILYWLVIIIYYDYLGWGYKRVIYDFEVWVWYEEMVVCLI